MGKEYARGNAGWKSASGLEGIRWFVMQGGGRAAEPDGDLLARWYERTWLITD